MRFSQWIRDYTGLTLYDFRVLDLDGTSEKQVRELFAAWIEDARPVPSLITQAMIDAAAQGFEIVPY